MKDELRQLLTNAVIMGAGIFTKIQFSKEKYTPMQLVSLIACGTVLIWLVHLTGIKTLYQGGINFIGGIWMANIIRGLVKAGNKNEDKLADKISKKIDENL